jgi:hypothetical protein
MKEREREGEEKDREREKEKKERGREKGRVWIVRKEKIPNRFSLIFHRKVFAYFHCIRV